MKIEYSDILFEMSHTLCQALLEQEPDLAQKVHELDGKVNKILRRLGLFVVSLVLAELSNQVTLKAKATGLTIHRAKRIKYSSLFGIVEMVSPYLWDKNTKRGARPVKEQLGIEHGDRSIAVQRALADFGAEESFGQAAKRFQEHYGWAIDRAAVRREVEKTATQAQQYVETRLFTAGWDYLQPLDVRAGVEKMLVELDGSHVRTGRKVVLEGVELTRKRRLPKSQRQGDWREVRVGLARPLQEWENRTYVAQMGKYPEVVGHLVSAAIVQGMSVRTQVIAVADGGNGLREALQQQFPRMTFILDRPHLKQHLYAGAEAIGLTGRERHSWVSDKLQLIDIGLVKLAIWQLNNYWGQGKERIANLSEYLQRFSDAVSYEEFLAQGLPIGSGEVESAHRYIPQKRLKIPGATWHPNTVNPMLALRIIRANNWWEDFWTQQLIRAERHSSVTTTANHTR
jgi:hypothetical protein